MQARFFGYDVPETQRRQLRLGRFTVSVTSVAWRMDAAHATSEGKVNSLTKRVAVRAVACAAAASALIAVGAGSANAGTAKGHFLVMAPAGVQSIQGSSFGCVKVRPGSWTSTRASGITAGFMGAYSDSLCKSELGLVFIPSDRSSNDNYWFSFKYSDIKGEHVSAA